MTSINGAYHMDSLPLLGLDKSSNVMLETMERLSYGMRINRSADDPSKLAWSKVTKQTSTARIARANKVNNFMISFLNQFK